jgi:hypothetical protein
MSSHLIALSPTAHLAVPLNRHARPMLSSPASSDESIGINLDNAIQAHADWRNKLRTAATKHEKLDVQTMSKDDCCEFGKWLHGKGGSKFGSRPVFVALIAGHKVFHIEAAKVARVVNQGSPNVEGLLGSGTPFSNASNEVGRLIVLLKRELSVSSKSAPRLAAPTKVFAKGTSTVKDEEWETF